MACGVRGDHLIVRLSAHDVEPVQAEPGVRPFDLTGRPMKGWLLVAADGHAEDDDLRRWVDRGVAYASSLPPKHREPTGRPTRPTAVPAGIDCEIRALPAPVRRWSDESGYRRRHGMNRNPMWTGGSSRLAIPWTRPCGGRGDHPWVGRPGDRVQQVEDAHLRLPRPHRQVQPVQAPAQQHVHRGAEISGDHPHPEGDGKLVRTMGFADLMSSRLAGRSGGRRPCLVRLEGGLVRQARSSTPASRSSSVTRAALGSGAPTRTPMGCCANTCPRVPTCASSTRLRWTPSRPSSTVALDKPSASRHPHRS
jgi:hypothetical protein